MRRGGGGGGAGVVQRINIHNLKSKQKAVHICASTNVKEL